MVLSKIRNHNGRRILALWLPRLPTDRIQRRPISAAGPDSPLVLAVKRDNALRVTAVNGKASGLGLKKGMALADARAMIQDLSVIDADEAADTTLLNGIADWCDRFTPFVALDPPHGLLLDVTGVSSLFGGDHGLLEQLRKALARQGLTGQAAIAGTAMAARALAHYADGTVVSPGQELQVVSPLPVEALRLDPLATHALRRAGLKTIGQVAARSSSELAARFGIDMLATIDCALGKAEKPISPRRAPPRYMAERRFPDPVVTEAVIAESILSLSKALSEMLEQQGYGARKLEAGFFRADGVVRRITVTTGKPTRNAILIERLFRERLNALSDPLESAFGFDLIRLEIRYAEKLAAQAIALEPGDAEDEIESLTDRLAARLGARRVLCFRPQNTHIPEAAEKTIPLQEAVPSELKWEGWRGRHEAPRRPLRLLTNPEPIDVMAEVPDGPPLRFRWRRMLHDVSRAEGPERIAMEWWRAQTLQATRDYFHVEDMDGRRFWLYRQGLYERETIDPVWYVHGLFA